MFPPLQLQSYHLVQKGGQSGVAVTCSHGNDQDVVLNPATDRNEKAHNGQTPAQRCLNSVTGSQWKTGDVKAN